MIPVLPSSIQIRPMTVADIPAAMRIKTMVHRNQTEADWAVFLHAGNQGNFIALYEGKIAGTVTTINYEAKFSWIGMVLVDPAYRGLGIGSTLVQVAINAAAQKGTIRLDATPQGMKLYQTLGFQVERELVRMERKTAEPLPDPAGICKAIDRQVLEKILAVDKRVFGADRQMVLQYLLDEAPHYAYFLERNAKLAGYCFGRTGSNFEHIGPVVADTLADARELLLTAIQVSQAKPLILDSYAEQQPWIAELQSLGFTLQRPFIRMHLGNLPVTGNIALQYAIAGPELG